MINEISVCVNDIVDRAYAIDAALKFASLHKARLTAIHIKLDTVQISRWVGSSPLEVANQILTDQDSIEENAQALFESMAARYDCTTCWKTIQLSNDPFKQMLCTDFIFVQQPLKNELTKSPNDKFISDLLLQSKRPTIMIPNGWREDKFGVNTLLGWNDSAEAMRAAAASLPILQTSEKVVVLNIIQQSIFNAEPSAHPNISSYLKAKGITNEMIFEAQPKSANEQSELLLYADQHDVDLIVIGAYGHSRVRETVLGGVTKHLISNSPIPVLLAH